MMFPDNSKFKIQHSTSGSGPLPLYLFSKTPHPDAIHIPILQITYLKPAIDFSRYDGLIVTSKEGVEALDALNGAWKELPLLCVGAKTADHARRHGAAVLEYADGYGDTLESIILERYAGKRWLYARPRKVASDFAERLRGSGVLIEEVVLYETSCNAMAASDVPDEAVLAFTSPSAISCFLQRHAFHPSHRIVVIGTTTAAALPEGIEAVVAPTTSVEALVKTGKEIACRGGGI
jgi:uroporphyrinogen-III synthase